MIEPRSFLVNSREEDEFDKRGRRFLRRVTERPSFGRRTPAPARPLVQLLSARLQTLFLRERFFECYAVEVRREDGMTWSAEAVARALEGIPGPGTCCRLAGTGFGTLPALTPLLDENRLFAVAARVGLLPRAMSLHRLRTWLLLGASVVLGALSFIAENAVDATNAGGSRGLVVSGVVFALTALLSHLFAARADLKPESGPRAALAEVLEHRIGSAAFEKLADAAAIELARGTPRRIVVIDNFERLDDFTREVVLRYVQRAAAKGEGRELWVVFERHDGTPFSIALDRELRDHTGGGDAPFHFFLQEYLPESDRETLAERIRKPERAEFVAVGELCGSDDQPDETLLRLFRQHCELRPRSVLSGELQLLYLISLLSGPSSRSVTPHFLNECCFGAKQRSETLAEFLGAPLYKEAMRQRLAAMEEHLGWAVSVERDAGGTSYRVHEEAVLILRKFADSFGLPDGRLGHLFWTVAWHDRGAEQPVDAFSIRQLIHHALQADPQTLPTPDQQSIFSKRLFEALAGALRGSVHVCLFSDVYRVLERMMSLLDDSGLSAEGNFRARLDEMCWEAHALLGDDRIARLTVGGVAPPAVEEDAEEAWVRKAAEIVAAPNGERDALAASYLSLPAGLNASAVVDHLAVRHDWVVLAMNARPELFPGTRLNEVSERWSGIPKVFAAAKARVDAAVPHPPALLDLATLSLSLGCFATAATHRLADVGEEGNVSYAIANQVLELAQVATDVAARLAGDARTPRGKLLSRAEFVQSALTQELGAVSLAAVASVAHSVYTLCGGRLLTDLQRQKGVRLFASVYQSWGMDPPAPVGLESDEAFHVADDLLDLVGLLWDRFGLDSWRDLLAIRRLQFAALRWGALEQGADRLAPYFGGVAGALTRTDAAGVAANLALGNAFRAAGELQMHYSVVAAELALAAPLGPALRQEFALVALTRAYRFAWDTPRLLDELLSPHPHGPPLLEAVLRSVSDDQLVPWVLRICNIVSGTHDPLAVRRLDELIRVVVDGVQNRDLRGELDTLLRVVILDRDVKAGRGLTEPFEVEWPGWKKSWLYPWYLKCVVAAGKATPEVIRDGLAVLDRDAWNDDSTTFLSLAEMLAERGGHEGTDVLVKYIKHGVRRFSTNLSAEGHLQIYRYLSANDPLDHDEHNARFFHWTRIKNERDHVRRLPALAAHGKHFLVFESYVDTLVDWGLRIEGRIGQLDDRRGADEDARRAAVARWTAAGARVPPPFADADESLIAAEFLVIGHFLFNSPHAELPELERYRQSFNDDARAALPRLIDTVLSLPKLPPTTRELVDQFRHRFYETEAEALSTAA